MKKNITAVPKRRHRWTRDDTELSILALPTTTWYVLFSFLPMFGIIIAFKDFKISGGYLLKPVAAEKLQSCVTKIVTERLHGTLEPCQAPESDPILGMAYSAFPPLINKILTMVRAEYGENISLKSLADRFRMNSTYLGQLFIQETRMKFSEYLMLFRMHEAYERICTTDDKIGDIAAAVGYSNVNYFYQHFHIYYDQSPSEIRAQHTTNGNPQL